MLHCLILIMSVSAAAFCGAAHAQEFPARPVRIVTSAVGGATDLVARLIAQGLTSSLGQQVIVDNRPTGIIPGEIVVAAPPDGYTLLFHGSSLWMMPLLQKVPFDPVKDLAPITLASSTPSLVVVHPAVPAKSLKELIALAKAKPGGLNYGSGTSGSSSHLAAELFKYMAKVDMVRIGYKGSGPAVNDLISGQVQLMFPTTGAALPHVRSNRLRALAVTSLERTALAPGLPTVAESGLPGYESLVVYGLLAPAKTPAAIIARLHAEVAQGLKTPAISERLFNTGVEVVASSPSDLARTMQKEMADLGKLMKDTRLRAN